MRIGTLVVGGLVMVFAVGTWATCFTLGAGEEGTSAELGGRAGGRVARLGQGPGAGGDIGCREAQARIERFLP